MTDTEGVRPLSDSSAGALAETTDRDGILPYKSRTFAPLDLWRIGQFKIKPYWISADVTAIQPDPALTDAARASVASTFDTVEDLGHHHSLGFAVVHHGEAGVWLLFYWWAFDSVFCTLRWHAEGQPPWRFNPVEERRINACVWEGIAVEHERQAWVRTMLRADPDPEAYLADLLAAGRH